MFHPPSNHPSFIEIEKNDHVVEKYKENIISVYNILIKDQLQQKVSLKKQMTGKGKLMNPSLTIRTGGRSKSVSLCGNLYPANTFNSKLSSKPKLKKLGKSASLGRSLGAVQPHDCKSNNVSRQKGRSLERSNTCYNLTKRKESSLKQPIKKINSGVISPEQRGIIVGVKSPEQRGSKSPVAYQKPDVELKSYGSLSIPKAEEPSTITYSQPFCNVGEKVMVTTASGFFKFGIVKFVGLTEFAPGEWIGVALEQRSGKLNLMWC